MKKSLQIKAQYYARLRLHVGDSGTKAHLAQHSQEMEREAEGAKAPVVRGLCSVKTSCPKIVSQSK